MSELASLFASLQTKQAHLRAPDETAAIESFRKIFDIEILLAGDVARNKRLATSKPIAVVKFGMPYRRFGYEMPPRFLLGAFLSSSKEAAISQHFDVTSQRLTIHTHTLSHLLANPSPEMDEKIVTFSGRTRPNHNYTLNFVAAPILGAIHERSGIEGLRSILCL